jgi:hypothetical protein
MCLESIDFFFFFQCQYRYWSCLTFVIVDFLIFISAMVEKLMHEENDRRTCLFITHEPEQHRDTSIYQNHVRIVHKRGRASLVDTESREPKKCKT